MLDDGRVLIAGGDSIAGTHAPAEISAEIYDPKSGMFSATGSMTTRRIAHAAILLADGRVLIAGGTPDTAACIASAEIYDPKTGRFTAAGSMLTCRSGPTATLLSDGRVLIPGGVRDWQDGGFLASAEIYDPKTGRFSATGSLAVARGMQTATLLSDGRVLIAGDAANLSSCLASAEIYDPTTGRFSATGSPASAHCSHTATLLSDGRVLVTGGGRWGGIDVLASADVYDPKTGTFSRTR